jgi:hypothetical protein
VRVAVWAAVVVAVVAPRLVGFTTDSDAYLDVARNLKDGRGLVQTVVDFWRPGNPDALGMWPPLYPAGIAALSLFGLPLTMAARLLSALAYVAFAIAFHALARRAGGRGFAFVAAIVVLLGPGLAQAGATAWSESLYLFLLTLGLVSAFDLTHRGARPPASAREAAWAGLGLGLAADTRYMGIALVPLVFALLWGGQLRRRTLAAWTAGAALPIALWLGHNLAEFGRLLGPGLPTGSRAPLEVLVAMAAALRWEFLPNAFAHLPWLAFPALIGVLGATLWAIQARGAPRWAALTALAQLGCVAFAVWHSGINDPQGRYTLVAWPFLGLVVCAAVHFAIVRLFSGRRSERVAEVMAAGLALVVVGAGLGRFVGTTVVPPGQAVARRHAQVALTRLMPPGPEPVLTDSGHLLRLSTGRPAVQVPPARFRVREFTADDARLWRERGVKQAIFRTDDHARLGTYLEQRLSGGAGSWTAEDSAADYVRYRVGP